MSDITNPTVPAPPPPPAAGISAPPVAYAAPAVRQVKSPAVAGVLSILTGAGHLYLGLYQRAAVFFAIWLLTMNIGHHIGGFPAFALVTFWMVFGIVDAVRQAQAINACCPPGGLPMTAPAPDDFANVRAGGSLGFGIFLILVGAWILLDRFVRIDLSFLLDWWPLLLVLVGAWQVFAYFKSKEKPRTDETAV